MSGQRGRTATSPADGPWTDLRGGYLGTPCSLTEARLIFERAGFDLVDEENHHSFGHDLVGQHWSRPL